MTHGFQQFISRQGTKDLPKFDGNPDDWVLFSTQYHRISEICQFSPDVNLIRLQRSLHGAAKEAVRALLVLPQSVNNIMEILRERFGRDEYVIKSVIKKTCRIATPRDDDPITIIEFATAVNNMVVTLQNLNRLECLDNPQLLEDIEVKLPPTMSLMWANVVVGKIHYNLIDLNAWLTQQSRALGARALPKEFDQKKERKTHKVFAAVDQTSGPSDVPKPVLCVLQAEVCVARQMRTIRQQICRRTLRNHQEVVHMLLVLAPRLRAARRV